MSDWKKVKSSNIAKVRCVDGDMEVQFTKGAVYRYKDVPEEVFDELLKAESVGKLFFAKIKGKFECEEVKEKKEEENNVDN
ncbi:KTSC domain-containing protein [Candidatus Pacearchaeota archaeon]|nr:KTSC domain-containing protein [Candidatus Pacearchaeota archaeon]